MKNRTLIAASLALASLLGWGLHVWGEPAVYLHPGPVDAHVEARP